MLGCHNIHLFGWMQWNTSYVYLIKRPVSAMYWLSLFKFNTANLLGIATKQHWPLNLRSWIVSYAQLLPQLFWFWEEHPVFRNGVMLFYKTKHSSCFGWAEGLCEIANEKKHFVKTKKDISLRKLFSLEQEKWNWLALKFLKQKVLRTDGHFVELSWTVSLSEKPVLMI